MKQTINVEFDDNEFPPLKKIKKQAGRKYVEFLMNLTGGKKSYTNDINKYRKKYIMSYF